ncbi:MAG: hypothetical protein WAX07_08735 [Candidatus Altiarchaeia archaeon]
MVPEKLTAIEKYASGAFSLSDAASFAGVSAGEMMEMKEAKESYNRIGKFLEK